MAIAYPKGGEIVTGARCSNKQGGGGRGELLAPNLIGTACGKRGWEPTVMQSSLQVYSDHSKFGLLGNARKEAGLIKSLSGML